MVNTFTLDLFNDPFFIGFNRDFERLSRIHNHATQSTYPPYNVIQMDDEDSFCIEVAVAGFSKSDLDVSVNEQTLTVKGEIKTESSGEKVIHKGIAARKFTREFALAEFIEVTGAEVKDGMLRISLERIVPEEKKPKTIKIK
jgi:molecular chaperone IbpA